MGGRHSLDLLEIREPCAVSWNRMQGDMRGRFCGHCRKTVHNLSAMTSDEAERLVCQAAGSLCVRYHVAPDGKVLTLDYPASTGRGRWSWRVWALVGLAGALVTGVVNAALFGQRVFPTPTSRVPMGAMVLPSPPGPYAPTYSPGAAGGAADDFNLGGASFGRRENQ